MVLMQRRQSKPQPEPSLIWAPGRNRDTLSNSPHASAHLENCGDKLAALWNETSFRGDNNVHSSTLCGTQVQFWWEYFIEHRNKAVVCCLSWLLVLKQVYTAWGLNTLKLYIKKMIWHNDGMIGHDDGIPWRERFSCPKRNEYTFSAKCWKREVANLGDINKNDTMLRIKNWFTLTIDWYGLHTLWHIMN